jgi:hypothetical protein
MTRLDENDLIEYGIINQVTHEMGWCGQLLSSIVYLAIAVLLFAVGGALILSPFLELFNALFA